MKILYLAPDINLFLKQNGGAGTHIRASIAELQKQHEVIIALGGDLIRTSVASQPIQNKATESPSFLQKIKKRVSKWIPEEIKNTLHDYQRKAFNVQVYAASEKLLGKEGLPDVIYERSGYGYDVGMRLAAKYKIPLCMETDVIMLDLIKPDTSWLYNRFIYRKLEQKKYDTADTITVQSEYSVEIAKKYWNIPHNFVFNKDLGITLSQHNNLANLDVRTKYGIKNSSYIVGYVGIFQRYQNVQILLEAAKWLQNEDIVFMLVGGGRDLEEFKQFVAKNALKNVIFTGVVDKSEVHAYYQAIDLGVIPDCAYHMYPVKFLEFGVIPKPVLVPKYEVFAPFFPTKTDFSQFTFQPKQAQDLSEKIKYMQQNAAKFGNSVAFTKKYILENNTWEICGRKIEYALKQAISRKFTQISADSSR